MTQPALRSLRRPLVAAALTLASLAAAASASITAQAPLPGVAPATTTAQTTARKPVPARPPNGHAIKDEAKPTWAELTPLQQQTLGPLAASWKSLSEAHKRKWIALAEGYPKMDADDQARLRSRMTEWAALSPQQRTQARLNFAESKKVAPDDRKAKWEAYQALPPEEKKRLAAGAAEVKPPPPPTAPAVKPVPQQKLANVPKAPKGDARAPRIAAGPDPLATPLAPSEPAGDIKR